MAMEAGEQDTLVALAYPDCHCLRRRQPRPGCRAAPVAQRRPCDPEGARRPGTEPAEERRTLTPAEIRRSIRPEGLISFEDGKTYKTLRRHLTRHGLTPEAYRTKWGLPANYPDDGASLLSATLSACTGPRLGQAAPRRS